MLDEEHRNPVVADRPQGAHHRIDLLLVEAGRGLVERDESGPGDEAAPDLSEAHSAGRCGGGRDVGHRPEREPLDHRVRQSSRLPFLTRRRTDRAHQAGPRPRGRAGQDVVADREARRETAVLERPSDSGPRPSVR